MLSWANVLSYIKSSLALPSTFIEKNDEQLKDHIKLVTIPAYSQYFPDEAVTGADTTLLSYKVDSKPNHYYFFDSEELDILGIQNIYFNNSSEFMTGHPIIGAFNANDAKEFALNVFKSNLLKPLSSFNYTWKFFEPNIIRILPKYTGFIAIEYEREQPKDLRKVHASMKIDFMNLALADIQILLGNMRSHYGEISTPWGPIPLQGDVLKSDGRELRERIIERLAENSLPPIQIHIH